MEANKERRAQGVPAGRPGCRRSSAPAFWRASGTLDFSAEARGLVTLSGPAGLLWFSPRGCVDPKSYTRPGETGPFPKA